jgi:hypothetical protein
VTRPRRRTASALALAVAALATAVVPLAAASSASADQAPSGANGGFSFAVIGDVPYGTAQIAAFPGWIDQINAAKPSLTFHVGDIKNGSSRCDDAYYRLIRADFDRFEKPLIYTPGDNEWTDCHRPNNGAYNPLERLAFDRSVFFDRPGRSLGQAPAPVVSQASAGFPENVQLRRAGVQFATIHVVGSNDGLQPWTGLGLDAPTPEQLAAEQARMDNALAVVRSSFAAARQHHDRAVVIFQQADMFDPTYTPAPDDISAFTPLVRTLVEESSTFDGDVYLLNGDSHVYTADRPLAAGSPWLATYGVTGSADNLQRITVDGSGNNTDWLRMTVHGTEPALTWERVPYTS